MIINTKIIKNLKPCKDRFNNYLKHYKNFEGTLEDFILLENITYNDKVWVVTRLFTKEQNVKWSLLCASKVLHIFEKARSDDRRPRQALEAVEAWLNNPSEENRLVAESAARSAAESAESARSAAESAAESAARSAARSAESAAESAAWSAARSAAWSAWSAARSAARSAESAESAESEEELNLLLMLECL